MTGTDNFPHDRMAELDLEVAAAAVPYDVFLEPGSEYSLGTLENFASSVKVIAAPIAEIDAASQIDGKNAVLSVWLAGELATAPFAVSHRAGRRRHLMLAGRW